MGRRQFWKIGGLLAAPLLAILIGNCFLPADRAFDRSSYGHDFLPFYTAGQLIRQGRINQLYDPQATRELEHATCAAAGLVIHNEYGAFLNPPFAALPAASLAYWPYPTALCIWTGFLLAFLATAVVLLVKMLPAGIGWRYWGLIPLLMFTALPIWQATLHAQNTFFSLLLLAGTVTLWRANRPIVAGMVAGLLLFKPQLAIIVAAVLCIHQGWPALLGWTATAAALLLLNILALPGSFTAYLHQLPINLAAIQALGNYQWHRHITFLAWWRMLLQGHNAALPTTPVRILAACCGVSIGIIFARGIWRARSDRRRLDRLIAASIVTMPLLMPYYMDYDLTLLSVAAVLCAGEAIRFGTDRAVAFAWIGFFIAMEINAAVGGVTIVIPAVPMLAVLSGVLIHRLSSTRQVEWADSTHRLNPPAALEKLAA